MKILGYKLQFEHTISSVRNLSFAGKKMIHVLNILSLIDFLEQIARLHSQCSFIQITPMSAIRKFK